jgi:DNA-binding transcriptional MocR family regulator
MNDRPYFAYQAVYRYLNRLVDNAPCGSVTKLPSLRHLALRLKVSVSTVQYACLIRIVNDHVKNNKNLQPNPCAPCRASERFIRPKAEKNVKIPHIFNLLFTLFETRLQSLL